MAMRKWQREQDKISIIIPVYNVVKYIDECLETVVNQTYQNLEIILVDDGSTDGSGEKCDEWKSKDKRIKVIHKKNEGLSSARNNGIRAATGEYIGFVDSDDYLERDMYEELHRLICAGNYSISICGIIRGNDLRVKKIKIKIKEYTPKEFIRKLLKVGTQEANQYAWNKLYQRNILTYNQYPEGLTDEDIVGTFRATLRSTKIIETTQKYYHYRINNENSITAPIFYKHRLDLLTICDSIVAIAESYEDSDIIEWAQAFRKRANFGILSRMAVMSISEEFQREEYSSIKNKLLNELKRDYKYLIRMRMPFSRKILITLFCIDYEVMVKILPKKIFRVK